LDLFEGVTVSHKKYTIAYIKTALKEF